MATKIPILFALMSQRNITQKQLGDGIGVSAGNISDWKSGRAAPGIEVLPKIADYLDCSVDYLLGRTVNPQSHKAQATNTVNGSYNAVGSANSVTVTSTAAPLDEYQTRLLELFNALSVDERIKLFEKLKK